MIRCELVTLLGCTIASAVFGSRFEGTGAVQEVYGVEKDGIVPVVHVYSEQGRYRGDVQAEKKGSGARRIECLKLSDTATCRIELFGGTGVIRGSLEVNAKDVARTIDVPEVLARIHGPKRDAIRCTIYPGGQNWLQNFSVERMKVNDGQTTCTLFITVMLYRFGSEGQKANLVIFDPIRVGLPAISTTTARRDRLAVDDSAAPATVQAAFFTSERRERSEARKRHVLLWSGGVLGLIVFGWWAVQRKRHCG